VETWCRKGSKIYAEGQLRTRKWQDRDGNDRYTTEVSIGGFNGRILLLGEPAAPGIEGRPSSAARGQQEAGGGREASPASTGHAPPGGLAPQPDPNDPLDDDVPF
jgi:single-strand DNA-binding protein